MIYLTGERKVMGPMPDLDARLVFGREGMAPYLVSGAEYPEADEFAVSFPAGDVQVTVIRPEAMVGESLEKVLAYLSHEAVHCTFRHMEAIGEENPGEEEMAYHVAAASFGLFSDLFRWLGAE